MIFKPLEPAIPASNKKRLLYALVILAACIIPALILRSLNLGRANAFVAPLVPFAGVMILIILFRSKVTKGGKHKIDHLTSAVFVGATFLGMFLALTIASPSTLNTLLANPTAVLMPLTMFLAMPGIQLLIFALRHRRTGDSLHCPKCDYELGVAPDDAPIRCPECGTAWLGRWTKGASRRSPALALVGALLILSGILPWALKLTALGSVSLSLLPNTALISVTALDAWGHNKDAWAELTARKLSPQDNDRLAEKLLNLRRSAGYLYGQPAAWLDAAVTTKAISQSLIDRYYTDWFEASINLPDTIPQGTPASISITADDRKGGPAAWMYIWIESVSVDGFPVTSPYFESHQKWHFSLDFTNPAFPSTAWRSNDSLAFATLDTSQPGPRTIRITAYRCVVPRASVPVALSFNRSTVVPPTTATHFAQFTIEKTVTISPP